MPDLTNMPSVWGDLQLPGSAGVPGNALQNQEILSEQMKLARKKKIMAAGGMQQDFMSATQLLTGSRTPNSGTQM